MTVGNANIPIIFVHEVAGTDKQTTSRNKAARKKILDNNQPQIKLPFPPRIDIKELIKPNKNGVKSKAPNCFMIYRQCYVREMRSQKFSYAMTDISGIISESWKREPSNVVQHYKDLAQKANKVHKEIYGTVPAPPKKNITKKEKKPSPKSRKEKNESDTQIPQTPTDDIVITDYSCFQPEFSLYSSHFPYFDDFFPFYNPFNEFFDFNNNEI
ncbi:hypothetical protein RclHR1_00630006 [Rhizophagus clarus]|uniref:HMG box domain-containing protein n=1 Tax=Rhizophagus clarus TaxID=94130 RepID=A0A2Z6SIF7_9GLOM|nr:hypothetical protein RclHR1_00630006 [Rhizophagus clarus]GES83133.1 hypothetical protein GLOIN_2v1521230 [Rhizophagus clarus]